MIDDVGSPAEGVRYTHVFDRGADNFEVFCHLVENRSDWVIRAAQLNRKILAPDGETLTLDAYLATLPVVGTYTVAVRAAKKQPPRRAKLEVRCGLVTLPMPSRCSAWLRACGVVSITMWVTEARETNPPPGAEPLRSLFVYVARGRVVRCPSHRRRAACDRLL